eukprot:2677525-Rhodomonas_salina.8
MSQRLTPSPTMPGGHVHTCVIFPSSTFILVHTAFTEHPPLFVLHSSMSCVTHPDVMMAPGMASRYPSHEHTNCPVTGFVRLGQQSVVSSGVFLQTHSVPFAQPHASSNWQSFEHPSPPGAPLSHCSPGSRMKLPHVACLQLDTPVAPKMGDVSSPQGHLCRSSPPGQ